MSVKYTGKTHIKEKINNILDEMLDDENLKYTIQIYENRENEKISKFMFEVTNIVDLIQNLREV